MIGILVRAFSRGLSAQGLRPWRSMIPEYSAAARRPSYEFEPLSTAEIHHIIYSCIRAIAQTAAQVPLIAVRENRELDDHPLLTLLERPNKESTRFELIEGIIWMLMLSGNSFIEVLFSGNRKPVELWHITEPVEVVPDATTGRVAGYQIRIGGNTRTFANDEIMHIKLFHARNCWYGLSPLASYREGFMTDLAAFQYNRSLLENNATPPGYLQLPRFLTEMQAKEMAEQWRRSQAGPANAGRVPILHSGAEFRTISLSNRDIQYIQQQRLSRENLKALYGVPGLFLGEGEFQIGAAQVATQVFMYTTILPILRRIEAALNAKLAPFFDETVRLRFDGSKVELLSEQLDTKAQIGERLLRQGWSINMIRERVWNLEPVDDPDCDQMYLPANLVPIGYVNVSTIGNVPKELSTKKVDHYAGNGIQNSDLRVPQH